MGHGDLSDQLYIVFGPAPNRDEVWKLYMFVNRSGEDTLWGELDFQFDGARFTIIAHESKPPQRSLEIAVNDHTRLRCLRMTINGEARDFCLPAAWLFSGDRDLDSDEASDPVLEIEDHDELVALSAACF